MRRFVFFSFLFCLMILLLLACTSPVKNSEKSITTDLITSPGTASTEKSLPQLPEVTFREHEYNFGDITQGEKIVHSYFFENTGNADLIITSASGSCGCTVPDWPRDPIAPGQKGEIDVVFDSEGKSGHMSKVITVVANTIPNKHILRISGDIVAPETN